MKVFRENLKSKKSGFHWMGKPNGNRAEISVEEFQMETFAFERESYLFQSWNKFIGRNCSTRISDADSLEKPNGERAEQRVRRF